MAPSLQPMTAVALVDAIDRLLPQTQCRRCGYDDCHAYAGAIARGEATIDRCPPGADATIQALAKLLDQPVVPLAADLEPMPVRHVVRIDPLHCIGCTKCILACPVDAIVGAPRFQHQVLTDRCTGCELCLPPCPTDCISLVPLASPWQASDARHGRQHHQRRDQRLKAPHASSSHAAENAPSGNGASDITAGHAGAQAESPTTGQPAPGTTDPLLRDPNVALVDTDEKARRLAAIRARIRMPRPRPTA